eukprot:352652-Chlamydomonas_euryale.AAC.2
MRGTGAHSAPPPASGPARVGACHWTSTTCAAPQPDSCPCTLPRHAASACVASMPWVRPCGGPTKLRPGSGPTAADASCRLHEQPASGRAKRRCLHEQPAPGRAQRHRLQEQPAPGRAQSRCLRQQPMSGRAARRAPTRACTVAASAHGCAMRLARGLQVRRQPWGRQRPVPATCRQPSTGSCRAASDTRAHAPRVLLLPRRRLQRLRLRIPHRLRR